MRAKAPSAPPNAARSPAYAHMRANGLVLTLVQTSTCARSAHNLEVLAGLMQLACGAFKGGAMMVAYTCPAGALQPAPIAAFKMRWAGERATA